MQIRKAFIISCVASLYLGAFRQEMVSKFAFKPILMHHPITFFPFWSPTSVKH
ncbi:hypothetical protein Hanom_Chr11g00986051 [Helianthus anomalus]